MIPRKADLFFLMENQAWEKVLVYFWNREKEGGIFGVVHATVRFWDMRYSYMPVENGSNDHLLSQTSLIVNGSLAKKQLIDFGYPQKLLFSAEAIRFQQLSSINLKSNSKGRKQLVVFTDYLESVSRFQMKILSEAKIYNKYSIIIKSHPAFLIENNDYPELEFKVTDEKIEIILQKANIVFCSNVTSAALEAFYLGLPVISARDPKELNFSPLFGLNESIYVSNGTDLLKALRLVEKEKFKAKRKDILNLNLNLPKWNSLLDHSNSVRSD
jgi:surface carbohydrate biosynthesis protein (TIGR04326 family)